MKRVGQRIVETQNVTTWREAERTKTKDYERERELETAVNLITPMDSPLVLKLITSLSLICGELSFLSSV